MSRNFGFIATGFLASAFLLGGCAAGEAIGESSLPTVVEGTPSEETPTAEPEDTPATPAEEESPEPEPEPTAAAPATQEESCGWDSPAITADPGSAPSSPGDSLESVIIGAWQHTHIDTGAGYEPNGDGVDIRYVFPSTTRLLYCQDVAGATSQAENAANITLDGTKIVLPGSAPGYTVASWSADTMVWTNNRDGSSYLLARR